MSDLQADIAAGNAWLRSDPLRFTEFNPAQVRFFKAIENPIPNTLNIVIFLKGNGVGGTWALGSALSAIYFNSRNPLFAGKSPFGKAWPFIKSARILSTVEALKDSGPIQKAMRDLFPAGRWSQRRGAGKPFYSEGKTNTGWDWDVMTYDQATLQAAGANKGLICFSEPPGHQIFVECCTRLRGDGLLIAEFTQLDMAEWAEDIVDAGGFMLDGKRVGNVKIVRGDVEDNCREHSPGGQRAHSAIEADIASWPAEEREARKTGKPLRLSGRIYPKWGDLHETEELSEYHQKCWDEKRVKISSVIDPHDRKPWAMAWFATFPNHDIVCIAEWPPFDFNACKSSPVMDIEDYRDIIIEAERDIGLPIWRRIMDPEYGEAANVGAGGNLFSLLSSACRRCNPERKIGVDSKCPHRLNYEHGKAFPGSVNVGHILVRKAIGDPEKGVRAKLYSLKSCPNFCYGHRRYAYLEQKNPLKGLSDRPQLKFKDLPDLSRYAYLSQLDEYPQDPENVELFTPKDRKASVRR